MLQNTNSIQTLDMKDQKSQEVIIQGFNAMRNDQKQIASKTTELQVCVIVN